MSDFESEEQDEKIRQGESGSLNENPEEHKEESRDDEKSEKSEKKRKREDVDPYNFFRLSTDPLPDDDAGEGRRKSGQPRFPLWGALVAVVAVLAFVNIFLIQRPTEQLIDFSTFRQLIENGKIVLSTANNWKVEIDNLPAQDTNGNTLYYYTFPNNNNHNYEIDFLLSRGNKIVPIEVKSSGYKSHKSLDLFCAKYSSRIGERILLYTKDYAKDGSIMCLPVYYAPFL